MLQVLQVFIQGREDELAPDRIITPRTGALYALAHIRSISFKLALYRPRRLPDDTVTIRARNGRFTVLAPHTPKGNHLLAALPAADYNRLRPHLEHAPLELGWALYESGSEQEYVYFPTTSIVSMLSVMGDGSSAEIAVVGNEGVVGIALFMGGETTPSRAVVQIAGNGYRLKANLLKGEFERAGPLHHLLLRYTQALITQMAQTAACNRHHSVEQQLCRWLLLSLDRLASNELTMTQGLIANMLGVRREGVPEAAGKLQAAGLIHYSRGKITVLDRPKLEARVCECYAVVKRESDRLLARATHGENSAEKSFE
jgi:CRP-like cAMP-binding protein